MLAPLHFSVRELQESEYERIVDYFLAATPDHLLTIGVDIRKLPEKEAWLKQLLEESRLPAKDKHLFYLAWLQDETPVGHSSINRIVFGKKAHMHLHLWEQDNRQKGIGSEFVRLSLPHYFNRFQLQKLYCEPYALNPAPNKTLKKLGFSFIERYEAVPGPLNFYQPVNKWCLGREKFEAIYPDKLNVRT
jgi:RimJ/RimL family protein N-acetyltransferase